MKEYRGAVIFGIVLGILVLGALFLTKDRLSYVVWEQLRLESVALALNTDDAILARRVGNYYFNVYGSGVHDFEKAKKAYYESLRRDPNVVRVHYQLGRIYFIEGNFPQAIQEIQKEIAINPTLPNSYYVLGLVYGYRGFPGDIERAEKGFKTFIEQVPDNWAGYNDLAWIYSKQGRFEEAKEIVLVAFERMPYLQERNVWLWTMIGVAELNLKHYTKARDYLEIARTISNDMTAEYFWSAYPGNISQNAETAFNQFKATLSFNLGIVYERLNQPRLAIAQYEEYLIFLPEGPYPQKNDVEKKIKQLEQ